MKELIKKRFPEFQDTLVHFIEEHGQIKEFKAGDSILRKGQYFKYTMLLLEGKIKLYRQGEQGDEFFMYHISPGEACALSMICASKSEQSEVLAKAIEDITLIAIPIEFMDEMMVQFKSWYYFVLETYRKRFEELISVIDAIA
ncbi:MAG TPA: Crp/Fnr family transcriptional regulator, partial [Cytophagaceae bacterium]